MKFSRYLDTRSFHSLFSINIASGSCMHSRLQGVTYLSPWRSYTVRKRDTRTTCWAGAISKDSLEWKFLFQIRTVSIIQVSYETHGIFNVKVFPLFFVYMFVVITIFFCRLLGKKCFASRNVAIFSCRSLGEKCFASRNTPYIQGSFNVVTRIFCVLMPFIIG